MWLWVGGIACQGTISGAVGDTHEDLATPDAGETPIADAGANFPADAGPAPAPAADAGNRSPSDSDNSGDSPPPPTTTDGADAGPSSPAPDDDPPPPDDDPPPPDDDSPAPPGGDVDEFDGAALDPGWSVLRPELIDVSVANGQLRITPNQYSVWYHEEAGALIHRNVSGNFKLTTLVRARRESDPSQPVGPWYQFGGLMALDPTTALHNYVFVVVGDRGDYLAVETKSTRNSQSDVQGPAWPSADAELRLCRLGSNFLLYKRAVGASEWTEAIRYSRPDLPDTLQVGPVAYAYTSRPDIRASFAWVSLAPAANEDDCVSPDL